MRVEPLVFFEGGDTSSVNVFKRRRLRRTIYRSGFARPNPRSTVCLWMKKPPIYQHLLEMVPRETEVTSLQAGPLFCFHGR